MIIIKKMIPLQCTDLSDEIYLYLDDKFNWSLVPRKARFPVRRTRSSGARGCRF